MTLTRLTSCQHLGQTCHAMTRGMLQHAGRPSTSLIETPPPSSYVRANHLAQAAERGGPGQVCPFYDARAGYITEKSLKYDFIMVKIHQEAIEHM